MGLIGKFRALVIEDLNVLGDDERAEGAGTELKRQLVCKSRWRHTEVELAHRGYPGSKTCGRCGVVNAKPKREWECGNCGARHGRNVNAEISLRNLIASPVRGEVLRDGRAPAVGGNAGGETPPNDRRTAAPLPVGEALLIACG